MQTDMIIAAWLSPPLTVLVVIFHAWYRAERRKNMLLNEGFLNEIKSLKSNLFWTSEAHQNLIKYNARLKQSNANFKAYFARKNQHDHKLAVDIANLGRELKSTTERNTKLEFIVNNSEKIRFIYDYFQKNPEVLELYKTASVRVKANQPIKP